MQLAKSREQAELLSSVREEIDAYNAPKPLSNQQYYASERTHINSTQQNAEIVLDIAHNAHTGLIAQKSVLSSSYKKLQDVAERFPVINQVMMKIRVRRRRDQVIIGALIALCIFILFM